MNTSDTITERPCRPGSEKGKIDVIVIGAGISGLTAAYRLHQAGASVQIIEAGSRPGGVVQSVEKDGFLIETGPNSFQSTGENIMALCRDLDLTPQPTAALAKKRYIYHSNQLLPLPSNPLQFLTTPLLSLIGKLRLLSEPFQPRYQGFEEETVAEFIRRRLGNEALDRLVNPFVSGVYAGNPEKLSAQSTFSALCKFEQEQGSIVKGALHTKKQKKKTQQGPRAPYQLLSFNGGLTQLPKALVQALPLGSCRYNTKVNAIQKTDEHYSILLSDGTQLDTAGVIIATPAQQAALLLQGIA
ncbi:MAG: protoporphyrinogen oxidase, partial [Vampirovibrio sp.]|nr:protoporphyrinogen oxidase [Vampirovibrio sp.]